MNYFYQSGLVVAVNVGLQKCLVGVKGWNLEPSVLKIEINRGSMAILWQLLFVIKRDHVELI